MKTSDKLTIEQATHLHYSPRYTTYRVLNHNLKIKSACGEWKLGCSYIGKDQQIYVRPYCMFNETKWKYLVDNKETINYIITPSESIL